MLGSVNCGTSIIIKYENHFLPRRHEKFHLKKVLRPLNVKFSGRKKESYKDTKLKLDPSFLFFFFDGRTIISCLLHFTMYTVITSSSRQKLFYIYIYIYIITTIQLLLRQSSLAYFDHTEIFGGILTIFEILKIFFRSILVILYSFLIF